MPIHESAEGRLVDDVSALEKSGKHVTQVVPRQGGKFLILYSEPQNDTGRPHLPSWAKEAR